MTARAAAFVLAAVAAASLPACRSAESAEQSSARKALALELVGRWRGVAVDAPEGTWFAHASFDLSFSEGGDFSAIASTFARRPYPLHFEGTYRVPWLDVIEVAEKDLGGRWKVRATGQGEITITRGDDLTIRVRKVIGT